MIYSLLSCLIEYLYEMSHTKIIWYKNAKSIATIIKIEIYVVKQVLVFSGIKHKICYAAFSESFSY